MRPFDRGWLTGRSARTWVVQSMVDPAATESMGVSAAREGGVPPLKWAGSGAPLESEAITTDGPAAGAVMLIVAMPSPVEATEQVVAPQLSVALPLETVKVTVSPPAGARLEEMQ